VIDLRHWSEVASLHVYKLFWYDQAIIPNQCSTCGSHSLLPVWCQWYVGRAGVFAGEGPLGLAVSDDETTGSSHCELIDWGIEQGKADEGD
jgi:hypothetical protein